MKIILLCVITSLVLIPTLISYSEALRQVAGLITIEIKPGETKTFEWGLASDSDAITTIELRAEGEGSEFLSFSKNVSIDPQQLVYTTITVTVPQDYPGGVELTPSMYATEFGELGGSTVMNIQMKKKVTLIVSPNDNPEFRFATPKTTEEKSTELPTEEKSTKPAEKGQTVIQQVENTKPGGGCLIATATYDSEMASQVQLLRELRDHKLLQTSSGSSFMAWFNSIYYSFSPTVADWERENPIFKDTVKVLITPMLSTLSLLTLVDMNSESEILSYGIGIIGLNIGMYVVMPAVTIYGIVHRKR